MTYDPTRTRLDVQPRRDVVTLAPGLDDRGPFPVPEHREGLTVEDVDALEEGPGFCSDCAELTIDLAEARHLLTAAEREIDRLREERPRLRDVLWNRLRGVIRG